MPVVCALWDADHRYERTVTGWVDAPEDGLLRLTARLRDHRADVEVSLDVRPSPSFEILRAEGKGRSRTPGVQGDDLLARVPRLAGLRLESGFRRRAVELLGPAPLASFLVDSTVEAARLSRQVTRIDCDMPDDPTARDFRRLDLLAWPEFADMCFTYSGASSPLFEDRSVRVPATLDMYAPRPGARLVFHRYKRTEITLVQRTLMLYQSMFDQVHGFEVWYDLDVETGRVLRARTLTPRLPYIGICEEPQGRIEALVGMELDARWPTVVRETIGGARGCFQLTHLTSDLLRLLRFE